MESLGRPVTIEDVFAIIDRMGQETRAGFEETRARFEETRSRFEETRAELKETREGLAEARAGIAETRASLERTRDSFAEVRAAQKEADRIVTNLGKNVGGLNRSLGELIETLVAARLWDKFPQYGFVRPYRRVPIFDKTNRLMTEIDILLSNTGKVMAVEVKRELNRKDDVDEHVKRMGLIRQDPPAETVGKQLLGAMAGGLVEADIAQYAYEAGFYVLELTGETVNLIPPPAGFKPGTW
jgi:hypothetical protein